MEATSKTKRRGRPRVFSNEQLKDSDGASSSLTRRQRQNRCYARLARERLTEMDLGKERLSTSVLAELGRIRDGGIFLDAVLLATTQRRRVKEMATEIRRMRIGKGARPDSRDLARRMLNLLHEYRAEHPDCEVYDLEDALHFALAGVRGMRRASEQGHVRH